MIIRYRSVLILSVLIFLSTSCTPKFPSPPPPTPTIIPPTILPTRETQPPTPIAQRTAIPFELVSLESISTYLEDLTAIQPYSGWRSTGSSGEAEALDYLGGKLQDFTWLQSQGLALERQQFKVFASFEFWQSTLVLEAGSQEIEVPASALRGSRFIPQLALSMDSDGKLNDLDKDPISASGPILVVEDEQQLLEMTKPEFNQKVLFLDYSLIDSVVNENFLENGKQLMALVNQGLAGVVLVTHYSNRDGESRGSMVGDGSVFQYLEHIARIPILYTRLEDLSPAGIESLQDLERIQEASLTWDADVLIPGSGGNLAAHIPGKDPSRAVILTAHVDSANSPGLFDNGAGCAILLEIARVMDQAHASPAVDLYLVWFGGHELGAYGSAHFAATHQELLDRSVAMMGIDGVGLALEGKSYPISVTTGTYRQFGTDETPWADYLAQLMAPYQLSPSVNIQTGLIADNSNFDVFNVPNLNLDYLDFDGFQLRGSGYGHFASHWHDPYETVDLIDQAGDTLMGMAKIALAAALETGRDPTSLRVTPPPARRALFIASHTEPDSIPTMMLRDLGMALAWEGFDVDMLPYGQALTGADLPDTAIAVLLPTLDFPGPNSESWSQAELDLLREYVAQGGFLVVTNTAHNVAMLRHLEDGNEDVTDLNKLLEPMGVKFWYGNLGGGMVRITQDHPLTLQARFLTSSLRNHQVPMEQTNGLVLAEGAIGLLAYGDQGGQVLVIADLGLLVDNADGAKNLDFVKNIAQYARSR